jgi:hypothetical protein
MKIDIGLSLNVVVFFLIWHNCQMEIWLRWFALELQVKWNW